MSDKILVTYASRTGSTAEIAEAIGKTLVEHGLQVDVYPMTEVKTLESYRAVVAGSAIRNRQWLPEAMQFIRTHQAALAPKPIALFTVCLTMSMKNKTYRQGVTEWVAPVRALVKPVREGYFAGILDISKVPSFRQKLMFRVSVMLGAWTEGDHRDWDAIHTWAADLKPLLETAATDHILA